MTTATPKAIALWLQSGAVVFTPEGYRINRVDGNGTIICKGGGMYLPECRMVAATQDYEHIYLEYEETT